jgi:hypothetical protein
VSSSQIVFAVFPQGTDCLDDTYSTLEWPAPQLAHRIDGFLPRAIRILLRVEFLAFARHFISPTVRQYHATTHPQ